ncbi:MAG: alkaline phosphatase family protein [Bacteroidetes bacterium]|nr:alkaline phosphatase family protein [Bacteroidota bacterium]MBU1486143.1 alkaline phosphatase family protein [Bacteroidota bacterium]MBU1761210.1 alkaline phosphatase family protein [Bacteroidota bacterium]MBU2045328.1 alkaline phosphatase family protein [Bacteroidota bacterium]MBU2267499.1 alkaline phosphatase family protein [Bacteroidota bacterium]
MKFIQTFFLAAIIFPIVVSAQNPKTPLLINQLTSSPARPKLVVGIVVDQMRWDYLYRYANRYGAGGFNRLLNEGFTCENTQIPYIPTVTAAGHTGIYTGSVPSITGIAGNDFTIQATGESLYCTEDHSVKTVGSTSTAGEMSPRNLLSSTITDELKLATNFRSKVIGIALKDRGGILPAGHTANAAYWYDDATGNWITSTFYMNQLPNWVNSFNSQRLPEKYIKQDWNTLYPINTYVQSTPDDNAYEGKMKGETAPIFPHLTSKLLNGNLSAIRATPFGNSLTLDFAKDALKSEKLGKGDQTDFLAISLSSTDYVGHQYGVNAIETEDTYLRLDRDLESFFNTLDAAVGKGNYTVFLSADHGAAHNPGFLKDHNIPADLWQGSGILKNLNTELEKKFSHPNLVINLGNYQVNFNNQLIEKQKLNEQNIIDFSISYLKKQEGVAYVVDMEKAPIAAIPDFLKTKIINGYNAQRSGAIQIILQPGWFQGYSSTGTTHGTWNPYDTHIPLVFMGWGIKHGSLNRPTSMADIAPTLAALLHIQEPNGNIGEPIEEVLKK